MTHSDQVETAIPALTESCRRLLLEAARTALLNHFGQPGGNLEVASAPLLAQPGMAFVTLKKAGRLRGCIGNLEGSWPLLRVVAECAVAAATRDLRFSPVQPDELQELHLSVSVLGEFRPLTTPEQLVIGRHGILLEKERQRGILLPQVAAELNLDVTGFLELACRKASLPTDAWRAGASIQIFTAQVFSAPMVEPEGVSRSPRQSV